MDSHRRRDGQRVPAAAGADPAPPAAPGRRADDAADDPKRERPRAELSRREREVLRLLAAGKTDREIADALGVSYRTVTTHIARVFAKLGVRSRAAAAAEAVRRGLA